MRSSPIVFLPGLVCDATVWADQRQLTNAANCLIGDYGTLDSLPAMAALILSQAPSRFTLIGHSMGGRIALEIMRQAPERVTALALLDTGHKPKPAGEAGETEKAGRYALLDVAKTQGMRAMGWQWVQGMVHASRLKDEVLVGAILDMIARKTPEIFAAQIKALLDRPDAVPVLRAIRCPTLVMCGRDDKWSTLAQHEEIAALTPGSKLAVIENAGHMATMEQPEAVTTALRRWMDEVAA